MKSLFIDTTEETTLGILDENLEFEECRHFTDKHSASRIHFNLNNMLQEHKIPLENIARLYVASGPGSYTGLRVTEGIAQIMKWQGKEILSCYQFEIPFMAGVEQGVWISQAWKGELFFYFWKGDEHWSKLVSDAEYEIKGEEYSFGGQCGGIDVCSTRDLLQRHSSIIFGTVTRRGKHLTPYYYRDVEQEFKPGL